MERSENINEFATAFAQAQGAMTVAAKDSTNPHFKSKYADLASVVDAVRPHLSSNGLSFTQSVSTEPGIVTVETTIFHKSGQWISNRLSVACRDLTPQPVGSAITYARRYTLMSICGIAPAEDDDGEAAQGRPQPQRPALPPKAPPPPAEPVKPTTLPEQFDGVGQVKEVRALVTAIKERAPVDRLKDLTALIQAYCAPTRDAQGKITAYVGTVPADPANYKTLCAKLADFK
jgi:hypothetical protein